MGILTIGTHQIISGLKHAGLSELQAEAIAKLHKASDQRCARASQTR
jgi:hypothetical protein